MTGPENTLASTVPQMRYNNLRLPVIWIDDAQNPNTFDPNEQYVHPNLVAINEFLDVKHTPRIEPAQFVQAGLKYLSDGALDKA